jgi:hypothetical protein
VLFFALIQNYEIAISARNSNQIRATSGVFQRKTQEVYHKNHTYLRQRNFVQYVSSGAAFLEPDFSDLPDSL